MNRITTVGTAALAVALSAGSVVAQVRTAPDTTRPQRDRMDQPKSDRTKQGSLYLHRSSDLIGGELDSRTGETLGSIEDFIVERGSGRIVFAIVEIGGVLGIGGTEIALPYERLSWDEVEDRFLTGMTEEEAQAQAEFLPDDWNNLQDVTWMDRITGWDRSEGYDPATERAIEAATGQREAEQVRGRITDIRRQDERTGLDMVVIDLETEDGLTREIILGPSWYVTGHDAAPVRGQTIIVTVREHDGRSYAWSAGERGNELMLRNDQGRSAWTQDQKADRMPGKSDRGDDRTSPDDRTNQDRPDPRSGGTAEGDRDRRIDRYPDAQYGIRAPTRYILLSNLVGADAEARGVSSGEIQGALIEHRSGRVAFLLFDPNENFLGIADTISMVPWNVAYINSAMNVNLDADASAFTNAMELPDDLGTLRTPASVEPAYRAFGVRPAQFPDRGASRDGQRREGWGDRTDRTDPDRPKGDRPRDPGRQP